MVESLDQNKRICKSKKNESKKGLLLDPTINEMDNVLIIGSSLQKFKQSERENSTIDREMLAIIERLNFF
jgi:hypothetical protein